MSKNGVYTTSNNGNTWSVAFAATMPGSYEPRGMMKHNGSYYIATKKQGVFVSENGETFTKLGGSSLSGDAVDVREIIISNDNVLFAATKKGIHSIDLNNPGASFVSIPGNNEDFSSLQIINNTVFAASKKDNNMFYINEEGNLTAFSNQTMGVLLDDPRGFVYFNNEKTFLVAHKKGVVEICFETIH